MVKNKKKIHYTPLLKPLYPIKYISANGITDLSPESITIDKVGKKAFGLSCLPKDWTLPFIIISDELVSQWLESESANKKKIIRHWISMILSAANSISIDINDKIIVRSSGEKEGIDERGKYYSKKGILNELKSPLEFCLKKLTADHDLEGDKIPLIIQKCVAPISAMGHLSNERRCYRELRDWLGVYEEPIEWEGKHFQINNRNWRVKINTEKMEHDSLRCNLSAHVSEVLKFPATWGSDRQVRLHFEWVWDGNIIYIVQADRENETIGIVPAKISELKKQLPPKFIPSFLKEIHSEHENKFEKIRNAILYKKLGLLNKKLYILDDQNVISEIAKGKIPPQIEKDIAELVKGSLVIRMDIATTDLKKRQFLPRTNVRKLDHATKWLIDVSAEIRKQGIMEELIFIFHNFIPAVSSAFSYSAPGQRQVQIEALWGLPEGLYYNKHDKCIVDTMESDYQNINPDELDKFKIKYKLNCKQFFVTPDADGSWKTKIVKPPYDWHRAIKYTKWIQKLAFYSRKIAESEKKSISIMWFIGVPKELSPNSIIPWYHEPYDPQITNRAITHRTKTPFDKSLVIRTAEDVETLRKETESGKSQVRRVRIQPNDEKLLRDKDTLKSIGQLAKEIDAVILLEGGVLSHAYYQLMETNAIVEVRHPFSDFEDSQEFNKLVRDKVATNISHGGEVVKMAKLYGEFFLRALKEKLIEEAFEVLDSVDQKAIIGELADVNEVIDGILSQLNVDKVELHRQQELKREKAGGFKSGVILQRTENPLPTKVEIHNQLFSDFEQNLEGESSLPDAIKAIKDSRYIHKWSDRRRHAAALETILRLTVPMTIDKWTETSPQIEIDSGMDGTIRAKVTGTRKGSKIQIEISFYIPNQQLKLF